MFSLNFDISRACTCVHPHSNVSYNCFCRKQLVMASFYYTLLAFSIFFVFIFHEFVVRINNVSSNMVLLLKTMKATKTTNRVHEDCIYRQHIGGHDVLLEKLGGDMSSN